jgi:uroporphyrinogen-III synthase
MGRAGVVITRAEPGASKSAKSVVTMGFSAIVVPLLQIHAVPNWENQLGNHDGLMVTSGNAARLLAVSALDRETPVFAVGTATAGLLRIGGFQNVLSADGDLSDLAALVTAKGKDLHLVYLSGQDVSGDLAALLASNDISLRRCVIYRAEMAVDWPIAPPAEPPLAVLFHSRRGAEAFASLQRRAQLTPLATVTAITISPKAAEPIDDLGWKQILVARMPNEKAILAELAAMAR